MVKTPPAPVQIAPGPTSTASQQITGDVEARIIACESGGNPTAENPTSSAAGLYQFTSGTWNNYQGYPTASSAPPEVQRAKFQEVWAEGAGAFHWASSRGCWY